MPGAVTFLTAARLPWPASPEQGSQVTMEYDLIFWLTKTFACWTAHRELAISGRTGRSPV
jgi:hypothetical protein